MPRRTKVIQQRGGVKITQIDVMGPSEKAGITYSVKGARTSESWVFGCLADALKRFEAEVEVAERRVQGR